MQGVTMKFYEYAGLSGAQARARIEWLSTRKHWYEPLEYQERICELQSLILRCQNS